jgi:hypothetical protein
VNLRYLYLLDTRLKTQHTGSQEQNLRRFSLVHGSGDRRLELTAPHAGTRRERAGIDRQPKIGTGNRDPWLRGPKIEVRNHRASSGSKNEAELLRHGKQERVQSRVNKFGAFC